jgi:hypothetical protein
MPRYRTISCEHCGHMLLKRDTVCEMCGRMTRRGKALLLAKVVPIVAVLIAAVVMFHTIGGLTPH